MPVIIINTLGCDKKKRAENTIFHLFADYQNFVITNLRKYYPDPESRLSFPIGRKQTTG